MYWWYKAAELVRVGRAKRFGLITTNSLRQTFARRVVQAQLEGSLSLVFAIPDHPWVDTGDGAAVRIAMTVGEAGDHLGELLEVMDERPLEDGSSQITICTTRGRIQPDISLGASISQARLLKASEGLSSNGSMLGGRGFLVPPDSDLRGPEGIIRPIINGNDLLSDCLEG
jgi:hypothetical protein